MNISATGLDKAKLTPPISIAEVIELCPLGSPRIFNPPVVILISDDFKLPSLNLMLTPPSVPWISILSTSALLFNVASKAPATNSSLMLYLYLLLRTILLSESFDSMLTVKVSPSTSVVTLVDAFFLVVDVMLYTVVVLSANDIFDPPVF